jgi:putative glutamine amidotransferase
VKITKIGIPKTGYSKADSWRNPLRWLYHNPKLQVVDITEKLTPDVDLILFDGGEDVFPSFYGEKTEKYTHFNKKRDFMEANIFEFYKNLPTVFTGICRGCQFLNVMMLGTLYQDLSTANLAHPTFHRILMNKDSSLMGYVKKEIFHVNSFHHQAVKDLGAGLRVVLKAYNTKVIEGIESLTDGKIRAIQSHPEMNGHDFNVEILRWLFRIEN